MPLPAGTKYRWKTYPSGEKVRLAFNPGGKVIEVKKKGGEAHDLREKVNAKMKGK